MQASSATIGSSELERQLEAQRPALTGYCYRMLASPFEAEDAVQETLLRARRGGSSRFQTTSSLPRLIRQTARWNASRSGLPSLRPCSISRLGSVLCWC